MLARLLSLQARLLPRGPFDVVRQVLLFGAAYYGYRLVRGAVDDPVGAAVAFKHARELISVEQTLHIFVEPSIQAWAVTKPAIIDPARFFPEWGFVDTVSDMVGVRHDSVVVDSLFNPYAAIPSMHVAYSLMIG